MPSPFSLRSIGAFLSLLCLACWVSAWAEPVEIIPTREAAWTRSLNGPWKFLYVAGPAKAAQSGFNAPNFDDRNWASLAVPAHWELHGFAEPRYGKVDEGFGYYRRTFTLPANWRDQRVMLRFEGVLYGLDVWVNGQSVGEWASSYNPVTFDITGALKIGQDNTLAVRVTTHPKGWEFDTNDCWGLSGIYRDVAIFAVPPTHLQRTRVQTTLGKEGQAYLQVAAWLAGAPEGAQVKARLTDPAGNDGQEFELPLHGEKGEIVLEVKKPRLWNAETPQLYRLELTLTRPGQRTETTAQNIGLRQVSIVNGILQLNGSPIKLHGVDHHDIWPQEGRVATEALMRRDLELIKAANCNFIRTSHYPPHPRLIELCDEMGVYVLDEVPFGFGDEHLKDPTYQDILLRRARATVLRDENRPSVIVWSVGNENPNTPLTFATAARVKQLDPSRPICFPQVGSYFAKSFEELPDWVDIYAPHYPSVATVLDYAKRLTRPIIFTEYAHALGLATDRIQDEWAIMRTSPRIAGGAVWMFQDQGILRTSEKSAEQVESNPHVWIDAHHYYDTNKLDGMDGIVYSDRTPQTDYWQVRKVYAPVQIKAVSPTTTTAAALELEVRNDFDFRSLSDLTLEWTLRRNREPISSGQLPLHAAAHATETVKLELNAPKSTPLDFVALSLRCLEASGTCLGEKVIPLNSDGQADRASALSGPDVSAAPRLETTPAAFRVILPNFLVELDRSTGELTLRDAQGVVLARGPQPHAGRARLTVTEELRSKHDSFWRGATLHQPQKLATSANSSPEGIVLRVNGQYPRNEVGGQSLNGGYSATIRPDGVIAIAYRFMPAQATGRWVEAGVSFLGGPEASEFRWIGAGPYAGFPGKDALNEFGIFHLNKADLYFGGNRRATEVAVLSTPQGAGFALVSSASDIAVEVTAEGVLLSHNPLLAGRGNKGVQAETLLRASEIKEISGSFSLIPLGSTWPAQLTAWFGPADEAAPPRHPFYRSYDQ